MSPLKLRSSDSTRESFVRNTHFVDLNLQIHDFDPRFHQGFPIGYQRLQMFDSPALVLTKHSKVLCLAF